MKHLLLLLLLFAAAQAQAALPPVSDVRTFGAKGDGASNDTAAVTNAIAACVRKGGGTVYFPPGRYVIGTVQLSSHIHLLLEPGATLIGSPEIADYLPSPPFGFARHYGVDITGEGTLLGMLIAKNAEDISIDGGGEIDGQGDRFMHLETPHGSNDYDEQSVRNPEKFRAAMNSLEYGPVEPSNRPGTMIVFFHCSNISLHNITLRNAPNWTLHLQDVEDAHISGIQIHNNPRTPNNDGIDCMQCRNVQIINCDIQTGDDGLAIVASEHIHVSNCSIASRSAAIRLESTQFSTFTGLSMDTNRGIGIFANSYPGQQDRPTEDILFANIVIKTKLIPGDWWGKAEPIYIAIQPCTALSPCTAKVRRVVFTNITAQAEGGVLLWGAEGAPIDALEFNGLRLLMSPPNPEISESIGGNLDLRWTALTPHDAILKSDIPAFYAKHVTGLRLRDVQVIWPAAMPDYFSDGLRVENFQDLTIDSYSGRQAQLENGAAISLKHGSGLAITNSRALPATQTFLHLDNIQDRRVFANYDLTCATKTIEPANQRFTTQLSNTLPKIKPASCR